MFSPFEMKSPIVWLLTLTMGGRTWRLATQVVEVTDASGASFPYEGGLGQPVIQGILRFLDDAPPEGLAINAVRLPGVLALLAQGHDLGTAVGEVAAWVPGRTWERRYVAFKGVCHEPTYDRDDWVAFTLRAKVEDDAGLTMPQSWVIDASVWPNCRSTDLGRHYPIVFGRPGVSSDEDGAALTFPGSDTRYVENTDLNQARIVIAGGRVEAEEVTVIDQESGASEVLPVEYVQDGRGITVASVDVSTPALLGVGGLSADLNTTFGVAWTHGRGSMSDRANRGLEGAGDILEWLLHRSSVQVDAGRVLAARERLNRFLLAGCLSQACSPWEVIRKGLMPIVPVSMVHGPRGAYPIAFEFEARFEDVIGEITIRPGRVERRQPVQFEGEITPDFGLCGAYDAQNRSHKRRWRLAAAPDHEGASNTVVQQAWTRWVARAKAWGSGPIPAAPVNEVKSDFVYTSVTADMVLNWRSFAYGLPWALVQLDISRHEFWMLDSLGRPVSFTDEDIGLANTVALIENIHIGAGSLDAQVMLRVRPWSL